MFFFLAESCKRGVERSEKTLRGIKPYLARFAQAKLGGIFRDPRNKDNFHKMPSDRRILQNATKNQIRAFCKIQERFPEPQYCQFFRTLYGRSKPLPYGTKKRNCFNLKKRYKPDLLQRGRLFILPLQTPNSAKILPFPLYHWSYA